MRFALEIYFKFWHAGRRWRLQGELSVSRSLGDLPYIDKGLTAEPTLSPWLSLNASAYPGSVAPEFLILASDGLFEALPAEEVCSIAHKLASGEPRLPNPSLPLRLCWP